MSFTQIGHITVTDCTRETLSGKRFLPGLLRGASGHGESLISFVFFFIFVCLNFYILRFAAVPQRSEKRSAEKPV